MGGGSADDDSEIVTSHRIILISLISRAGGWKANLDWVYENQKLLLGFVIISINNS